MTRNITGNKTHFMKPVSKSAIILLPVIAFAIILQSCGASEAKGEKESAEAVAAPALEAFSLQKEQLSSSIRIPGELAAFQRVDLYAKVSSFVKKLYVDVGSEVHAGQLLVTMEAPEI